MTDHEDHRVERPLTTSFAAPVSNQAPQAEAEQSAASWRAVAPIAAASITALDAIEIRSKVEAAVRAYRSALRQLGEAAAALGGPEAMEAVLHQVADADPARADQRLAVLREAWTGLPGSGKKAGA